MVDGPSKYSGGAFQEVANPSVASAWVGMQPDGRNVHSKPHVKPAKL